MSEIPKIGAELYVIGKNEETLQLRQYFKIIGIIDDFAPEDAYWNEIPLIRTVQIPEGALVINTSSSISPKSAARKIKTLVPGVALYSYYEVVNWYPSLLSLPKFVQEMQADWDENQDKWKWLCDLLTDDYSDKVLGDVIKFRKTGNLEFLADYDLNLKEQYFDRVVQLQEREVFVDCGGFDGDTTEEFIKRMPNYEKIWFFEPSPSICRRLKRD